MGPTVISDIGPTISLGPLKENETIVFFINDRNWYVNLLKPAGYMLHQQV